MSEVRLGNDLAIEGYRDPESDDPEQVKFKPQDGQHTTTIIMPEGLTLQEQFFTVVGTAQLHMEEGAGPVWVEGDDETLVALLKDHWQIEKERPKNWGTGKTVRDRDEFKAQYAETQAQAEGDEEE